MDFQKKYGKILLPLITPYDENEEIDYGKYAEPDLVAHRRYARQRIPTDCGRHLQDRKSTRLNSSHSDRSRMPSSA